MTLSKHLEEISFRRCRGCGWKGPGYLQTCIKCAAAMGDQFSERFKILTPPVLPKNKKRSPSQILKIAALSLQITIPDSVSWNLAKLEHDAIEILKYLEEAADTTIVSEATGTSSAILSRKTLHDSLLSAVAIAEKIQSAWSDEDLELRLGLAHGLVHSGNPRESATVQLAEKLSRAAQRGQMLSTLAVSKELRNEWDFLPVGILPRREQDKMEIAAILFKGRKTPAPTPSAFAVDDGGELVGRKVELDRISEQLQQVVQDHRTRWCALVAPAGGGKSKLLRTWLAKTRQDDQVVVLGASCSPFGAQPFSSIDALLEDLGQGRLPINTSTLRASRILQQALDESTRKKTTIIIVEDLHWADESSLKVLEHLRKNDKSTRNCFVIIALRTSFLPCVRSWLLEGDTKPLYLPGLSPEERRTFAHRYLADRKFSNIADRLAQSPLAENPLYLEQSAAYVVESGNLDSFPRSLHEVVLMRLEILLKSLDNIRYFSFLITPDSKKEIENIELKIGEWLDRLETGDYEGRAAIAQYLGLLQSIDAQLLVLKSIHGLPTIRNRRLADSIRRFYSTGLDENIEMIKKLANRDPTSAAWAAERAAYQASENLRLDDYIEYLKLEEQYTQSDVVETFKKKGNIFIELGDALLYSKQFSDSESCYHRALEYFRRNDDDDISLLGRCEQRLGHVQVLLKKWQEAADSLKEAMLHAVKRDKFLALCDYSFVSAYLEKNADEGDWQIRKAVEEFEKLKGKNEPSQAKMSHYLEGVRLQIALLRQDNKCKRTNKDDCDSNIYKLLTQYVNTFVFESSSLEEVSDFTNTQQIIRVTQCRLT